MRFYLIMSVKQQPKIRNKKKVKQKIIPYKTILFLSVFLANNAAFADVIAKGALLQRGPGIWGKNYDSYIEAKEALYNFEPQAIPYPIGHQSSSSSYTQYFDVLVAYQFAGMDDIGPGYYYSWAVSTVYSGKTIEEAISNTISETQNTCSTYPHRNIRIYSIELTSAYRIKTHDYTVKVGWSKCTENTIKYRDDRIDAKFYRHSITLKCPKGYAADKSTKNTCLGYSVQENPQEISCNDKEGNPCNPATGNKFQTFNDYSSASRNGITFKRNYLSQNNNPNQFTSNWQHSYRSVMNTVSSRLTPLKTARANKVGLQQSGYHPTADDACIEGWQEIKEKAFRGLLSFAQAEYADGDLCYVKQDGEIVATLTIHSSGKVDSGNPITTRLIHRIIKSDGSQYLFQQQGTEWKDQDHLEASLVSQDANWLLTDAKDNQELFDEQGRLIQMTNRQGQVTHLQHDLTVAEGGDDKSETLDKVTGPFGRSLTFSYQDSDGKLASVNTPDGLIQYSYDTAENLTEVTYPDGKTETYHYENTAFPHHLTGITDEKGNRFATWDYDDQGRAILSEHAGHTEKVTFVYNADSTTTVTGALGDTRTYHFDWIKGGLKVKKITGDKCTSCGNGDMKERSYDDNGFLSSYIDWNGNITTYTHDSTGLELTRTEASGTAEAQTIITEWHSDFRVPIKVTQGNKITEYSYDAQGRLLSTTIRNVQ